MIVFTSTRTEESSSLSLFSNQFFTQSYYNSLFSIQFYKIASEAPLRKQRGKLPRIFSLMLKDGPDSVAVSIGGCGALDASSNLALGPLNLEVKND